MTRTTKNTLLQRFPHLLTAGLAVGACAAPKSHATVFTFTPTCAPFNWISQCAGASCGGSLFTQTNNFGSSTCGGVPLLPGAGDDVIFAGNGVINAGVGVRSISINAGVVASHTANINTTAGYTNNGTVFLEGAGKTYSGLIANTGTWNDLSPGMTVAMSSATFTNDGQWNLGAHTFTRVGSSSNNVINNGTLTKTSPVTSSLPSIGFAQNGLLHVQEGTLVLSGTFAKSFGPASTSNTSSGASLVLGGTDISGTLTGTNAGAMSFTGGDLAANLTLNVTGNPFDWTGGNLALSGFTLQTTAATDVRVSGAANRTASSGTIINAGDWIDDTGGFITSMSSASFTNSGTFTMAGQSYARVGSSTNTIINTGTLNKTTPIASTLTEIRFNQNGVMNVQQGVMTLQGSFESTFGAASVTNTSPGATLAFSSKSVAGTLDGVNSGSITFASVSLFDNFTYSASGNPLLWNGGNLGLGSRTLTIGPAASVRQVGAFNRSAGGGTIINNGTWTDDSGGFVTSLSTVAITNNGTWNIVSHSYGRFGSSTNSFTNNGTMRKTSAAAAAFTSVPFTNNGLIEVEEGVFSRTSSFVYTQNPGGILRVHAGAVAEPGNAVWQGGRLEGLGTINASNSYSFSGAVVISPGVPSDPGGELSIIGGTQMLLTSDDALEIELDARPTAPGGADRVTCSQNVSLGGAALRVSLAPGFVPTLGDEYDVIRSTLGLTPISGTFTPVFDVPAGVTFSVTYFPQFVRLTVTGTLCDDIDFNSNDVFPEDQDIVDLLDVIAGGECAACNDIDFNNNGVFPEDQDVMDFFNVLAGGSCS